MERPKFRSQMLCRRALKYFRSPIWESACLVAYLSCGVTHANCLIAASAVINTVGAVQAASTAKLVESRTRVAAEATTWLPKLPSARPNTASPGAKQGPAPVCGPQRTTMPAQSPPVAWTMCTQYHA